MKHLGSIVAVLAMCAVPLLPIVLAVDDPQTPYNESETPINLETPVLISTVAVTQLNSHVRGRITISRCQRLCWGDDVMVYARTAMRRIQVSDSRQDFLDALRC